MEQEAVHKEILSRVYYSILDHASVDMFDISKYEK
jgi:hypothetical protein